MHHDLGRRGELGYVFELPSCKSVGEAEFSWARIVSNKAESDTCKWRREGNSQHYKQIRG